MIRFSMRRYLWILVGCGTISGCSLISLSETPPIPSEVPADSAAEIVETPAEDTAADAGTTEAGASTPEAEPATEPETGGRDFFREGVNRAQSAVAIGQSAQSPEDWSLAASRWKQAVSMMSQVPASDPNYPTAQEKVKEYQQNLAQAERRAAGENPTVTATAASDRPQGLVAQIPIVNRLGGTPVVAVRLTGSQNAQQFPMLFDTGATFTLITPAMAQAIGVPIIGEMTAIVADGRSVRLPVGYIDTLEVGGLVLRDVQVGIGGDAALLGQDVYGDYGLSVGGSTISLYE